ncbi:hypothetical protein Taro_042747 [Colocasia esculenta]|uniref:Uncharacterized protein n=1 Tax=Colocasia esculenta TaxID=4460 RepID=A0A843WPN8_COLES|nr:hypothetical protein [Colocasia esculenta]
MTLPLAMLSTGLEVRRVRVQPARRSCGNPWTEETYGGLEQRLTSPAKGVSDGEFVQVNRVYIESSARHYRGVLEQWSVDIDIHKTSRETIDKYRVFMKDMKQYVVEIND